MIEENWQFTLPDYDGGSIVNLMVSITDKLKSRQKGFDNIYPPLKIFPVNRMTDTKRIALVVVDGLGDHLYSNLKNFNSLDNWLLGTITSVYPPTTASAISTFMTGTAPQQHGLTGWYIFLRELGAVATILPFVSRYGQYPLEREGIQPLDFIGCPSLAQNLSGKSGFLQPIEIYDSAFSRSLACTGDRKSYQNLGQLGSLVGDFVTNETDLDYLYAYIPNIDTLAHRFGPYSSQVQKEYLKISRLLSDLCELSQDSGTLLLITADHGFIHNPEEKRISLKDHPDLQTMLTLPLCGEPRTAYAYVKSNRIIDFQNYVENHLNHAVELRLPSDVISENWFGKGKPHEHLEHRLGDFVLCLKENYAIYDALMGEQIPSLLGVHGGTSRSEQIVPLFSAGP